MRYADDCNVYVQSRRAGGRVLGLLRRLYTGLRLRINESKSAVASAFDRKLLGYSFWVAPGNSQTPSCEQGHCHDERTSAPANEAHRGSKQFPGLRGASELPAGLEAILQWRRGTTIYRELRARGLPEHAAATVVANGRRWWKNSGMLIHLAFPTNYFDSLSVPRLAA